MPTPLILDSPTWEQFQKAARQHQCNPEQLLEEYMQEYLEIWEDRHLDEAIQKEVQAGPYREEDAVAIVRQHRQEKRNRHAPA